MKELTKMIYLNQVRDKLLYVHEKFRTNTKYRNNSEYNIMYERLDKAIEMLGNISFDYAQEYDGSKEIVLLEDIRLYPGETKEIQTNITGYEIDESYFLEFLGYIPSDSYLQFRYEMTDEGLKLYASNISAIDKTDIHSGYHYHNPITIDYYKPGVMELFKGSKIGMFVSDYNQENGMVRIRH